MAQFSPPRPIAPPHGAAILLKMPKRVTPKKVKPLHAGEDRERQEKQPKPDKMSTTEHVLAPTVDSPGVFVDHSEYEGIQYDVYIPYLIWKHPAVKTFRNGLSSVELGASIFKRFTGVWKGDKEKTNIYRMIVYAGRFQRGTLRVALQNEIGKMTAALSADKKLAQQAVLFTETKIKLTMSGNVRRR